MKAWRGLVLVAAIGLLAGLGGAYLGLRLFSAPPVDNGVHAAIHRNLDLTSEQDRELHAIESRFASRNAELEEEMRAANRELAVAIDEDKAYTARVQAAVDHFHHAMGALQKATVEHIFEMRAVLTPEQQVAFDTTIKEALIASSDGQQAANGAPQ